MRKSVNLKMVVGVVMLVIVFIVPLAYSIKASTTKSFFPNLIIHNDTSPHYSEEFGTAKTSTAPYLIYEYVYTEAPYYVGSRYRTSNASYVYMEATKYNAIQNVAGRVTKVQLQPGYQNQVYIKGTSNLYMEIDYMRITY